jgi:hypothetical protein
MYFTLLKQECTPEKFVDFWYSIYKYDSEYLYLDNILKENFSPDDLRDLFIWKNGMRLSRFKNITLERKILHKLQKINQLKQSFSLEGYKYIFSDLPTIWKIFLLHCIQPRNYPIFDRHVFRAMQYLQSGIMVEISEAKKQKLDQYCNLYLSFFNNFVQESNRDNVKVDRALWRFGKYLKDPLVLKFIGFAG